MLCSAAVRCVLIPLPKDAALQAVGPTKVPNFAHARQERRRRKWCGVFCTSSLLEHCTNEIRMS